MFGAFLSRVLLNREPDGFATCFGFGDAALEAVEPEVRVEHLTLDAVVAYEDAALRVLHRVACVDADALPFLVEFGTAKQEREPLLELRRVGDDDGVTALGNGAAPLFDMVMKFDMFSISAYKVTKI